MADGREVDDQVDFEDDNSEEMADDDYVEEQLNATGLGEDDDKHEDVVEENDTSLGEDDDDAGKRAEMLALPPRGSEDFIGALSKDVVEEDLSELCEQFGDVVEVRLVRNKETNESKGFAFVAFKTKNVAQKACEELNNKEFKGRTLRCSLSESKYRLFIGNVPKNWTDDDFRKVFEETGPGSEVIELIKVIFETDATYEQDICCRYI